MRGTDLTALTPGDLALTPATELVALSEHRCAVCGYGVAVRVLPEECPMCRGAFWDRQGLRRSQGEPQRHENPRPGEADPPEPPRVPEPWPPPDEADRPSPDPPDREDEPDRGRGARRVSLRA